MKKSPIECTIQEELRDTREEIVARIEPLERAAKKTDQIYDLLVGSQELHVQGIKKEHDEMFQLYATLKAENIHVKWKRVEKWLERIDAFWWLFTGLIGVIGIENLYQLLKAIIPVVEKIATGTSGTVYAR